MGFIKPQENRFNLKLISPTLIGKSVPSTLSYGMREDNTPKGLGYFGELPIAGSKFVTELSMAVDIGDKKMLIPILVPTLTDKEIDYLLQGNEPTPEIIKKAIEHAILRIRQGKSPFAQLGEQISKPTSFRTDILYKAWQFK